MSNSRKIKILADASNLGSAKNLETNDLINFRRGDSLEIDVGFLQNAKLCDLSSARSATLEVLDIGGFNAVKPRDVSLLMRKEAVEFSSLEADLSIQEILEEETLQASFVFDQTETAISAGEKWLRIFVDFTDGSRLTFASGWINVLENYSSEPNLLPIENPRYYTMASADETFLKISENLNDLPNIELARNNLDVYSKQETCELVNSSVTGNHTHNDYLEKFFNLSDLYDKDLALANLGGVSLSRFSGLENEVYSHKDILSNLLFRKDDFASVKFNNGYLKTKQIDWVSGVYSFCFDLKIDATPTATLPIFSVLDVFRISASANGIQVLVSLNGSTFTATYRYQNSNFEFGKFNNIVCVIDCKNHFVKLFLSGVEYNYAVESEGEWGQWSSFKTHCLIGSDGDNLADKIELSRIKIFNANLAEENSIYSIDDFSKGIDESQTLRLGILQNLDPNMGASTNGGWNNTAGTRGDWSVGTIGGYGVAVIENYDVSQDQEAQDLGIESAISYGTRYSHGIGATNTLYNNKIDLSPYKGKSVTFRYSFYIKALQDTTYFNINFGTIPSTGSNYQRLIVIYKSESKVVLDEWVKVEGFKTVTIPSPSGNSPMPLNFVVHPNYSTNAVNSEAVAVVANLNIEVLGVVASFDMRGNSNQLKDKTLNTNHAIAFNDVEFSETQNPAYCAETFSWAGTQVSQVASVKLLKNSQVQIFARSKSVTSITASVNSVSTTSSLTANSLTKLGDWLVNSDCFATLTPCEIFTGNVEFFYKIERL